MNENYGPKLDYSRDLIMTEIYRLTTRSIHVLHELCYINSKIYNSYNRNYYNEKYDGSNNVDEPRVGMKLSQFN